MDLRSLKTRINRLLEAQGGGNEPPSAVLLVPENGRGPRSDTPYPRVFRTGKAAVIMYLPTDGQPDGATIARLIEKARA